MEFSLGLPGDTLTQHLQHANLVGASAWLALLLWGNGHNLQSCQLIGSLGLFSAAAWWQSGLSGAGLLRLPTWHRLSLITCGESQFTQGFAVGGVLGGLLVCGAGIGIAYLHGRKSFSRKADKPRSRRDKDARIAELRRKMAEMQAEIEQLQSSRPSSCATSCATSPCPSPRRNSPQRSRLNSTGSSCVSPARSRSPRKSAGAGMGLPDTVDCAEVTLHDVGEEDAVHKDCWQSAPQDLVVHEKDAESFGTGQRTPPEGWAPQRRRSLGAGLGQFFQMSKDGEDDDDDRRKSHRRSRKWSLESIYNSGW